jgi:hypothetical protein
MQSLKNIKIFTILLALFFAVSGVTAQVSTVSTSKVVIKKETFPQFMIAPNAGAIFPLTNNLRSDFKPGGMFGLDLGVKLNKEVALYGKFSYMFMSSKKSGAPIGQYFEFSAGPRYYFTHPKLKSQVYFEGGAGAYYFKQNSFVNPEDQSQTIEQVRQTNAGINGGIGASLYLSKVVNILAKAKYHNVFTRTGSVGFMTVNAGLEFNIR